MVPQLRTLILGATLTLVGIFLPNLLLGFNQKYQGWVTSGNSCVSLSYLYTYYSFISAVVFSALLLAYMNAKSLSWHPGLRRALISIGMIAIMALSFAVEVRNQYFAFDQKLSHRKWELMDEVIQSPAFMGIPDGKPSQRKGYHHGCKEEQEGQDIDCRKHQSQQKDIPPHIVKMVVGSSDRL